MSILQANDEVNGRYLLKEYRGRGTFGEVWLAEDLAKDEDVAIKFYVSLDHKGREEFINEFRISAKLDHPNLLVTKDYGVWNDHPFLTMKFCGSGSAGDLVGKLHPCPEDETTIWRFIRDVAAGLAYLHSANIVHQDIKPDNILIDSDGTFLISDFGISTHIRNTMMKQSVTKLQAGAPAYMGPERFSKNPEPILASDVWSLGASIYELAEGELPFSGMGGQMLLNGADMAELGEGWSRELNDIMQSCLNKETWGRPKAGDVAEIAERHLKGETEADKEETEVAKEEVYDPKATRRAVSSGTHFLKDRHEKKPEPHTNDEQQEKKPKERTPAKEETETPWWKLKKTWGAAAAVLVLVGTAIGFLTFNHGNNATDNVQTAVVQKTDTVKADTTRINVNKVDSTKLAQNTTATTKTNDNPKTMSATAPSKSVTTKAAKPTNDIESTKGETAKSSGTLNLGYATWTGGIKNNKPDGNGTMTFTQAHVIDTYDSRSRMASPGDRVTGAYYNGHLDFGRWHKSDGTTESLMIGR